MNIYSQKVIDAFFQTFYHERIEIAKQVGKSYNKQLDISLLNFWFSVIDFYGGIYYIGKKDRKETYDRKPSNGHNLKFAHKKSFIKFIKDFFPTPENELGEFLYTVFRSGIVHQLSPKKGGIIWDESNSKLLWMIIDTHNPDNLANKIAFLNIYKLEQLTYDAYSKFRRKIENNELVTECERIFNLLLSIPDGLEDGFTIHDQYMKLSSLVQSQITI